MNENMQKTGSVYNVSCTCGNAATIITTDIKAKKSLYECACGKQYVRDDVTGNVVLRAPAILTAHIVALPQELDDHYGERSAATGKEISALILEDLELCFKQWKRSQERYERRGM